MKCQISIVTVSGKKKLWRQIGEELKKSGKFQLHLLKLLSFYYRRSSNN